MKMWRNTTKKAKDASILSSLICMDTKFDNNMILFNLSLNLMILFLNFSKRPHINKDTIYIYKFRINLISNQHGILVAQSIIRDSKLKYGNNNNNNNKESIVRKKKKKNTIVFLIFSKS